MVYVFVLRLVNSYSRPRRRSAHRNLECFIRRGLVVHRVHAITRGCTDIRSVSTRILYPRIREDLRGERLTSDVSRQAAETRERPIRFGFADNIQRESRVGDVFNREIAF